MMKIINMLGLSVLTLAVIVTKLWAFEIVSPPQNTAVHPGDSVLIKVQLSSGEEVGGIYFDGLHAFIAEPPYEYSYKIGPNQLGDIVIPIMALKPETAGPFTTVEDEFSSEKELHLISTLASTIKIQSLRATFMRDEITFYLKQDIETGNYLPRTERLRVYAMYSDGVERDVSSASAGTTYTSSDASVLTISADGLMTALKPGNVKITITSGGKKVAKDATVSKF